MDIYEYVSGDSECLDLLHLPRDRHRSRRATATDGTVRHGSRTVSGPGRSVFTIPWPYRAVERDSTVTSCQKSTKSIRNGGRSESKARKVDFRAFGTFLDYHIADICLH